MVNVLIKYFVCSCPNNVKLEWRDGFSKRFERLEKRWIQLNNNQPRRWNGRWQMEWTNAVYSCTVVLYITRQQCFRNIISSQVMVKFWKLNDKFSFIYSIIIIFLSYQYNYSTSTFGKFKLYLNMSITMLKTVEIWTQQWEYNLRISLL